MRRAEPTSKSKFANIVPLTHRDEVEAAIVDWLRDAYDLHDKLQTKPKLTARRSRRISR